MAIRRRILSVVLLIQIGLLGAACSPFTEVFQQIVQGSVVDPTSVVLTYRTPKPSATPRVVNTPTPTTTKNFDLDYYYGGLTITMDDVGQIVPLRRGQSFSLYLGGDYTWQVESSPDFLISQNVKITPAPGEQGIFVARERGEGVFKAIGEPNCRQQQPPCERPSIMFQVSVMIE